MPTIHSQRFQLTQDAIIDFPRKTETVKPRVMKSRKNPRLANPANTARKCGSSTRSRNRNFGAHLSQYR